MTTDDLRTRAREAAAEAHPEPWPGMVPMAQFSYAEGYAAGYLAHAAQQPSREQIARAIHADDLLRDGGDSWDDQDPHLRDWYLNNADAVLALLDGAGS